MQSPFTVFFFNNNIHYINTNFNNKAFKTRLLCMLFCLKDSNIKMVNNLGPDLTPFTMLLQRRRAGCQERSCGMMMPGGVEKYMRVVS